jgi:hypothetical protein
MRTLPRISKEQRIKELQEPEDPSLKLLSDFEGEDSLLAAALAACTGWNGKDPIGPIQTGPTVLNKDGSPANPDKVAFFKLEADYAADELRKLGWTVEIVYDVDIEESNFRVHELHIC